MKRQLGPVATGKPSQKGKGRRRPGETRWRSAAAVERRAERGALRRAEAALQASGSVAEEPVEVPRAESLSFAEGLRLQSAPQLGAPDFVDSNNPVRGGLPTQSGASWSARRGFDRFAKRYPHLAEQVRRFPGQTARHSYARETGGRRVSHGLREQGLEPVAEETDSEVVLEQIRQDLATQVDEDATVFSEPEASSSSSVPTAVTRTVGGRAVTRVPADRATVIPEEEDNQTVVTETTLTHPPTTVGYSVDEEEEEQTAEVAAEQEQGEQDNHSSSSYSRSDSYSSRSSSTNWSYGKDNWERYEPYHLNYRYQRTVWQDWDWQWGAQGKGQAQYGYYRGW